MTTWPRKHKKHFIYDVRRCGHINIKLTHTKCRKCSGERLERHLRAIRASSPRKKKLLKKITLLGVIIMVRNCCNALPKWHAGLILIIIVIKLSAINVFGYAVFCYRRLLKHQVSLQLWSKNWSKDNHKLIIIKHVIGYTIKRRLNANLFSCFHEMLYI